MGWGGGVGGGYRLAIFSSKAKWIFFPFNIGQKKKSYIYKMFILSSNKRWKWDKLGFAKRGVFMKTKIHITQYYIDYIFFDKFT